MLRVRRHMLNLGGMISPRVLSRGSKRVALQKGSFGECVLIQFWGPRTINSQGNTAERIFGGISVQGNIAKTTFFPTVPQGHKDRVTTFGKSRGPPQIPA